MTDDDLLRMLEESEGDEFDDNDFLNNKMTSTFSIYNRKLLTHIENEQDMEIGQDYIEQNVEGDVVVEVIAQESFDGEPAIIPGNIIISFIDNFVNPEVEVGLTKKREIKWKKLRNYQPEEIPFTRQSEVNKDSGENENSPYF